MAMLDKKYKALETEAKWQQYWKDEGVYKFDENSDKEIYSIDTPPPTVSGKIHIGHIFSYSQAEIYARYKRMRGYNVFYPFGFDDNGLPTERFVEKKYGRKAESMSREEFNELCLKTTEEYEEMFRNLFISMGFSADWSHTYSSIEPKSQKTSQKSFIDLYKKGKVYFSESPALWCTECKTSVAQAEIETRELPSKFNHLRFKVKETGEEMVIATTRPEFLAACVAVFVHPDDEANAHLVGKTAVVPLFDIEVPIIADSKVELGKGSGIVMCCTFGDITDIEWWKKYKLPLKKLVSDDGRVAEWVPTYAGLKVEEARKQIIADLDEKGLLIKSEELVHNVATHERCGHPMEFILKKQWFIKIVEDKQKFLNAGDKINWYPSFMKERYVNWVENIGWDWCISRQRYYGVPFPVWYCKDCGEIIVADEEDLPVNPLSSNPKHACPKCGCNEFIPEADIMDTWATSSVTPQINSGWATNDSLFNKITPMSMRPNAHDIIRTWDFYTIVKSIYHFGNIPWENVMISGHVLAGKGEKISKSKTNAKTEPDELRDEYSADVVRYWAVNGRLGNDIVLADDEFKNGKKLVTKLFNASKFVLMHLQDYDKNSKVELLPMDKWILGQVAKVTEEFKNYMEKYEIGLGIGAIEKFFWDFCDNYIEIVKDRLYKPEVHGDEARLSGQKASYLALLAILKLFAPYFPHITEEIYQDYFREKEGAKSIHITEFEDLSEYIDEELIEKAEVIKEIITEVRKYKSENNLSLKTEITELVIEAEPKVVEFAKTVEGDIRTTCNATNIVYKEGKELKIEMKAAEVE